MPTAELNGIRIGYDVRGSGPLVVLVMGLGSPGRVWQLHQVPALVAAGYRVATFDNRGIGASEPGPPGMTIDDMVADTAALVEHLGGGPAAVVGTSLGARVVQELLLARPELVSRAVVLAGHGRLDATQQALSAGECALHDAGIALPPRYRAAVTALHNLSPRTRADAVAVRDWLDLFEMSDPAAGPGVRAQLALAEFEDRGPAYRAISVPTLVVGFADDQMIPAHLSRELADAIPGAEYAEVADCGHFGYLERPDEVNALLVGFLGAR
ncbi:alpha/beta fold hydrolase [Pseudonocardia xinjiangensis]|uniref:alpha/beta fold hydrolase n=1 Tax=Pseudonocardia xinjiangensis TaxID=75289 RepID=UPI003D91A44C